MTLEDTDDLFRPTQYWYVVCRGYDLGVYVSWVNGARRWLEVHHQPLRISYDMDTVSGSNARKERCHRPTEASRMFSRVKFCRAPLQCENTLWNISDDQPGQ